MWQIKERKKRKTRKQNTSTKKYIAYFYRNLEEIP